MLHHSPKSAVLFEESKREGKGKKRGKRGKTGKKEALPHNLQIERSTQFGLHDVFLEKPHQLAKHINLHVMICRLWDSDSLHALLQDQDRFLYRPRIRPMDTMRLMPLLELLLEHLLEFVLARYNIMYTPHNRSKLNILIQYIESCAFRGLCLSFDNVTNTLIKRYIAAAVGKFHKLRRERLRELDAPWITKK